MRLAHALRTTAVGVIAAAGACRRSEPAYEPPPASYTVLTVDLADSAGEPERLRGAAVWAAFFPPEVPEARPLLGRTFQPSDFAEGGAEGGAGGVVVLGARLWRRRYGARPQVIGHTLDLNGRRATIVGVMPPGFDVPAGTDVWMPAPR
jgi:hypothetical protein